MSASAFFRSVALSCLGISLGACGASKQTQSPGAPPTPQSVTKDDPGGDAHDPHFAALSRQIESGWGWRTDKDRQARFPLPDRKKWTRVRFYLINHFVGFKYGDDQHSLSAGFVVPLPEGAPRTSAACVEQFERESMPKVAEFGGSVTDIETKLRKWREQPLVVRRATGEVRFMGKKYNAALTWTAYPAYEADCLAYAVAVQWDGQRELAEKARNRWARGFREFVPLTDEPPYRH